MQFMTKSHKNNVLTLSKSLNTEQNFDIVERKLIIGGRDTTMFFIDGFIKDEVFEKLLEFLFKITPDEIASFPNMEEFTKVKMPYVETDWTTDFSKVEFSVLSGQTAFVIDGFEEALLVDTRTYPARSIEEPDKDRSLRGSRDGFVETLIFNTTLIRRRIRDTRLVMEHHVIGSGTKLDVAISYIDGKVDRKTLNVLRKRLSKITLPGMAITLEAVCELLVPPTVLSPFPRIRFSERPDFVSACIMEGRIALVIDNSPAVLIFPTSFVDFAKETDDYYFPPLVGSYIRTIRLFVSFLTVYLTPFALLFLNNPDTVPHFLRFVLSEEKALLPYFAQFLILELVIDGLRLASINTPNSLSSSLGIIGGLLLGEFAVQADWFVPETIIYMSFVAISGFAQPSFEMGYAMKFSRYMLLILTQLFGLYGIILGTIIIFLQMLFTKTLSGRCYLYPIIPFNFKDFCKIFIRTKLKNDEV